MHPYIYSRALSPVKATLLNLMWACLQCSCATDGLSRELNPFPAHVHLHEKLPYQDNSGQSDQPLQTQGQRLPAMAVQGITGDQATFW